MLNCELLQVLACFSEKIAVRSIDKLVLEIIDKKLKNFSETVVSPPAEGWIKAIRTTLKMPRRLLAEKLGVTPEAVRQTEEREATGNVTLNAMEDAARALGMRFTYAIIPAEGSLSGHIERRAREVATQIVKRTHQQMALEAQEVDQEKLAAAIETATTELVNNFDKHLWE